MTMLGEFVLPRGGLVWTRALVSALTLFGTEHKSAWQADWHPAARRHWERLTSDRRPD